VSAVAGTTGDLTVDVGDVTTTGDNEPGVQANTNYGGDGRGIAITAGNVLTTGSASIGIQAQAYTGPLSIVAGSVKTTGYGSDAIYASSYSGDVTVSVGNVATEGTGGRGITAYSGGTTSVIADSVTTTGAGIGLDFDAGAIKAVGASVNVVAGDISTSGDTSVGIYARSNFIHDNGQLDHDINVTAGSIATAGLGSDAVHVVNVNQDGNTDIKVDTISTTGDYAWGVYALSVDGSTTVSANELSTSGFGATGVIALAGKDAAVSIGSLTTTGDYATGIVAYAGGDATVTAQALTTTGFGSDGIFASSSSGKATVTVGDVATGGHFATAIGASGVSTEVTVNGSISTYGAYSRGVRSLAYGGDGVIHNNGTVETNGVAATALYARATGDVTIDGGGDVATHGYFGAGVVAASGGGSITIKQGSVQTSGDKATGVYAGSRDIYGTGGSGNITIDVESAATKGTRSNAIMAVNATQGGNISVAVQDSVETRREDSRGIFAYAYYGDVGIDVAGDVSTRGSSAGGILGVGQSTSIKVDGAVKTIGDDSTAIAAIGTTGTASVSANSVTTSGDYSAAIASIGASGSSVIATSVETAGDFSRGVDAYSQNGLATVTIKDATTHGLFSDAVIANGTSALLKTTGKISTHGDFSVGVRGYSVNGGVTITNSGSVQTSGRNSYGLLASGFGPMALTNSGTITTSGLFARGIYAIASPSETSGVSILNTGTISTSGPRSDGIRAIAKGGSVSVVSTGGVTVTGDSSVGILAASDRGGRGERANTVETAEGKTVQVNAGAVTATGTKSVGIVAVNYNGDISLDSAKITATGSGGGGIATVSTGKTDVRAGSILSDSMAVYSRAYGDIAIDVKGAVKSNSDTAIVATSFGGNTTVNVAAGGSVTGSGHRVPVYVYGGNGITLASWSGTATVNNAGLVTTSGDGYAIEIIGFSYQPERRGVINNSGRIDGAIHVTELDDLFVNTGTFNATKNSNFDLGKDLLTNSGTVKLATSTAASVAFLGLEKFDNRGGLVDLRNGHSGDVFTLTGDYVGSGDARLGLDLNGGSADQLVITGAATGKTKVLLTDISAGSARLTGSKPITIIKVGVGSQANAFSLDTNDMGLINYALSYDALPRTYALVGTAGGGVYRAAKISEGSAAAWDVSSKAWASHMAELRDAAVTEGSSGKLLWAQGLGQSDKRDQSRQVASPGQPARSYDLSYRQDHLGGQLGLDLPASDRIRLGVTAGYLSSSLNFSAANEKVERTSANLGGYLGYRAGRGFANALLKYEHSSIKAKSDALGYSDKLTGTSYGAEAEAGLRLGSNALYAEPVLGLAWSKTNVGDLNVLGQSIAFNGGSRVNGKIGARIGASRPLASGGTLIFYGAGHLVHSLSGHASATLASGNASEQVQNAETKTIGQATLGLNVLAKGRISAFLEGNASAGSGYKAAGGRLGLRIKL
jgi:hypothetical protein